MIAGTLTPSSANLVPRPKHLGQDDDETRNNASGRTRTDSSGRSAALERAYVHDVYENCEEPVGPLRPRVAQFLASLDPGSIVCDVGCGNGRYLTSCNPFIYTIGVDRCYRLTKVARAKGGEVAICDNLELPFRDESFDAVLSLAVVHHFATTERRVGAIRELARILRIGGRVIITVWALEQRHRRFESQDVLIPWQPPKNRNSNASDDEDDDDYLPPYHAYTEDSTNSSRSAGDGDSSSLSSSSPGESCYSFVRRAIQKLAGGKKHPWFLESWNSKDTKQDSSLDYEDAKDLPIELRRLEDFDDFPEPPLSAGLKSRSLGSILNPPPRTIVRSRSSVPSLGAQIPETKPQPVAVENATSRRPKLVKQKQSLCDEDDFPLVDSTFQTSSVITNESRLLLRKQSSLNEELMAESRLREKERVRKRIQKQMSLNEAFLCRSLFTKRLQVIREGFTTKLKTSTGSLERVTKSGLVKIMQNLKGTNHQGQCYNQNQTKFQGTNIVTKTATTTGTKDNYIMEKTTASSTVTAATNPTVNGDDDQKPRRHSRESGSDSSKDSSLQSDTSIESEDSFASVIYIPRPDQQATITDLTTNSNAKMPSVPTSPLVMPCPTPAHSPAPPRCKMQTKPKETTQFTFEIAQIQKSDDAISSGGKGKGNNSGTIQMIKSEKIKSHQKITKQIVKDLPPIPKFKKAPSFPIVRRVSAAPAVPKLMSLEIFNPETDDLDSDSSEPSSPDSIDSVISALKPSVSKSPGDGCSGSEVPPFIEAAAIVVNKLEEAVELVLRESKSSDRISSEMNLDLFTDNDKKNDDFVCRQHLVDFAEKLSAQLLKELDENSDVIAQDDECDLLDDKSDESFFTLDDPYIKKLNGEIRDLNTLREELRERRLMLANLNTTGPHHYHHHHNAHPHHHYHPYQNNNNHSNNNNSTSSVIHEEDESPKNDSISELIDDGPLYSSCSSVIPPDTALLLQQDDDNSPEESFTEIMNNNKLSEIHNVITTMDQKHVVSNNISIGGNRSTINLNNSNNNNINNNNNNNNSNNIMNSKLINNNNHRSSAPTLVDSRQSVDSWGHSNSTASLDSPSVGGAATHHRYYHVFREGELDALINHHVASLHIVSSYYERASWCVVAEKVQVWTI